MKKPSVVTLLAAAVLFVVFFANVAIGAAGHKPVFGDIPEMLILFASSICFAISVLLFEAEDKKSRAQTNDRA
ncbi:MAG: hypothetical protein MPJ78_01840 [Hyphomicrobiaceae bacterium]|nr:hypothetical protein [Hyphomicrobiaceae bacterium]